MISIRELAGVVHPAKCAARRHLVLLRFYCDLSFDGDTRPEARTYVVAGFLANEATWSEVERRWQRVNEKFHVRRFKAAHLNRKYGEYEGWSDEHKIEYSAALLQILNDQGKALHAFSIGLFADEYARIINDDGREKLGHPYVACFKTCIAGIAREMSIDLPNERVAVVLDKDLDPLYLDAVKAFYELKEDAGFEYRHHLATCTPSNTSDCVCLEAADLIAFEQFKRLHDTRDKDPEAEMRKPLSLLYQSNGIHEAYIGPKQWRQWKTEIESASCGPNRFVVIPKDF